MRPSNSCSINELNCKYQARSANQVERLMPALRYYPTGMLDLSCTVELVIQNHGTEPIGGVSHEVEDQRTTRQGNVHHRGTR